MSESNVHLKTVNGRFALFSRFFVSLSTSIKQCLLNITKRTLCKIYLLFFPQPSLGLKVILQRWPFLSPLICVF